MDGGSGGGRDGGPDDGPDGDRDDDRVGGMGGGSGGGSGGRRDGDPDGDRDDDRVGGMGGGSGGGRDGGPDGDPDSDRVGGMGGGSGGGRDGGRAGPPDEVVARITPAAGRRYASVGMLSALGLLLIWVLLAAPPADPAWWAFLAGAAAVALWLARKQWRATETGLMLTRTELRDGTGAVLARVDEIETLDRGMFAFRPSNGFLLRLAAPRPRAWAPGLWWRLGRRVGVGGVTGAAETRAMAEILSVMLAERALRAQGPDGDKDGPDKPS